MIILIRTTEDKKFWTKSYTEEGDFMKFKSRTKDGKDRVVLVNKKHIIEITTMEGDFPSESE